MIQIIPPQAGPTGSVLGDAFKLLATGRETGGRYAVMEISCAPGGGPPPHIHRREDECFYVLCGAVDFFANGQWTTATAGSFVRVPKDAVHTYRGREAGSRLLVQVFPAGLEEFFQEISVPAGTPITEALVQNVLTTATKYGIEFPASS
jgi:quercetin dioxygenase-like cupin family protein